MAEYNEEMNTAYKELKAAASKGGEVAAGEDGEVVVEEDGDAASSKDGKALKEDSYPPALRLCFDWYEQQENEGGKGGYRSMRSISAQMKAARDELTTLVRILLTLSGLC